MGKKLKKNNGFTGIDISVSVIIILIFIPTIFGIVYNIQKSNAGVARKTKAVEIATDILEIAKSEEYADVETENSKFVTDVNEKYNLSDYTNTEKEEEGYNYIYYSAIGDNGEHYQIQIGIKNYYPSSDENEDLIKQIKVRVFYPYGNIIKNVDIGMVKQNI